MAGGIVSTGFTLSTIVMVCCFVTAFPLASVNVQVLTNEEVPGHGPKIRSPSVKVAFLPPSGQLSASSEGWPVIDGDALKLHPSPLYMVIPAGTVNVGGVLSVTVTVKEQAELFPEASLTLYVTSVVPTGKLLPGEWDEVHASAADWVQLSVAVGGIHVAVWLQLILPGPVSTLMLPGHPEITGASLSFTVTMMLQFVTFPDASVALQITVVFPAGKTSPARVEALLKLFWMVVPVQLSLKETGSNSVP
jgi:hypothetical protein